MMLLQPAGEDAGDAGIKAGAEQRHDAGILEPVVIVPLPLIFELRLVARLVIGGVEIIGAGRQAGIHDRQILIGQRQIDHQIGFLLLDQRGQRRHIIGVDLRGCDGNAGALFDRLGDRFAFGQRSTGQQYLAERAIARRDQLRHLVYRYRTDAAGADHQYFAHDFHSKCWRNENPAYRERP